MIWRIIYVFLYIHYVLYVCIRFICRRKEWMKEYLPVSHPLPKNNMLGHVAIRDPSSQAPPQHKNMSLDSPLAGISTVGLCFIFGWDSDAISTRHQACQEWSWGLEALFFWCPNRMEARVLMDCGWMMCYDCVSPQWDVETCLNSTK